MTLAQLQALAAVVELGSLTAAAERLSRSQSAISHALTELEDLTEVKLLWRDRQPVVLTAAGERLWPYVQNVVREAQLLRQQFSLSRGKLEGKLVVASLPSVSLAFVVPALEALKEMHGACRRCCSKARTAKSKGGSTTVRPMSAWWPARRRSHTLCRCSTRILSRWRPTACLPAARACRRSSCPRHRSSSRRLGAGR